MRIAANVALACALSACGARSDLSAGLPSSDAAAGHPSGAPCDGDADCANGLCLAGVCATNARACAPGQPATVLATVPPDASIGAPWSIAVDADSVYWSTTDSSNDGSLFRVAKAGGAVTTLATTNAGGFEIAVDGQHVYWAMGSGVSTVPLGGGLPATLASLGDTAESIAADLTHVYVSTSQGGVFAVAKSGGDPKALVPAEAGDCCHAIDTIVVDDTSVWLSRDDEVMQVAKGGGQATTFASATLGGIGGVAVDATTVYWFDGAAPNGAILARPKAGGDVVTVAEIGDADRIVIDESTVYWAELNGGRVAKVAKGGGEVVTLVMTLVGTSSPIGTALAVDDSCVYWADGMGNVWKVPK